MMTLQDIKATLNERAEEFVRSLFPGGTKKGREFKVGSLQGEEGDSLSICIEGAKRGVFCDYATGEKGDNLIELFVQARRVLFKDALRACVEWLGPSVTPSARTAPVPRLEPPRCGCRPIDIYEPTDQDIRVVQRMVESLVSDSSLCERIARGRGWKPETVRQLGLETYLGWQGENLCFIYDTGAKLRQWRTKGQKVIWWAFGKPWLWRGAWMKQADTVYVCEGEPDCISLVDAGIENDRRTVAIAMPSASTFDSAWAALFERKNVILAFDNDKAGSDATARVSKLLRARVRSLKKLNWEGLRYATAS